ncbi:MAG TPA: hypothetical protein VFW73_10895, partial [Lacipirellulaceae bacterium]|nr:hypothetical protein [Lacipirellulaceae bacterium]
REAEQQYRWLLRRAIRLADKSGRFTLTASDDIPQQSPERAWEEEQFATAIKLAGNKSDLAAAAVALPRGAVEHRAKRGSAHLPHASLNSEWAGITIMAEGWSQSQARLAIAFVENPMTIELSVDGAPLLLGQWPIDTSCDGTPVHPMGEWEELCWQSRKRFDLLELGLDLSNGLRLERQFLFARDDRVLYIADAIVSSDRSVHEISHSMRLPLARGARWKPEAETRDGLIVQGRSRAAVLPLALHEWRCDPRGGSLEQQGDQLVLTQANRAAALCCPLFIDLDHKRSKRERTWRQLTIAEDLKAVPRDVAVGYRAQSNRDQWLFYRSLARPGNRTVLGQNFAGEFCAGRFLTTGELREWVEIECS